jgi:CspA family cold shock protein
MTAAFALWLLKSCLSPFHPRSVVDEVEGVVKFYNSSKGFGFISTVNGSKDVFIHTSTLARSGVVTLVEGQAVWVQCAEGTKGLEARSVRLV